MATGLVSAVSGTGNSNTAVLDVATLQALADEARAWWQAAGADITPLLGVQVNVADLQGALIGLVSLHSGTPSLTLDVNAAGNGWFVDATPADNSEFATLVSPEAARANSGAAVGREDLLSAIAHEFGHILGLTHIEASLAPNSLMQDSLPTGTRRMPVTADLTRALAGDLINGNFSFSDPSFYEFGWSTSGAATVQNGTGVLSEDPRLASRLRQSFTLPANASTLQFTLTGGSMSSATGIPPDAFEVALLNSTTLSSLVGTTGLSGSDAFLNLQSTGTLYKSNLVTLHDLQGNLLSSIDLSQPVVVTVDLANVTAGTQATLYFDLLGFGALDSTVRIDDVHVLTPSSPVNQPPVANADSATLAEDSSVLINVLANDSDPEGDFISVTAVGSASHGQTVIENGQLRYTPLVNYFGASATPSPTALATPPAPA
jgi:hypothetical protein